MNRPKNRILIAIIVLVLSVMACVGGGGGGSVNGGNKVSNSMVIAPDATATYGAQQLKIQLTAVAQPGKP